MLCVGMKGPTHDRYHLGRCHRTDNNRVVCSRQLALPARAEASDAMDAFAITTSVQHRDLVRPPHFCSQPLSCFGDLSAGAIRDWLFHPNAEARPRRDDDPLSRSEEHTSELQSLMRISYAVFCLKKKKIKHNTQS